STARTIQRMPDSSATKGFGLAGKIFLGSTLLVVAVLGAAFGVTSLEANRTADASIHRALLGTRSAVDDYLAARTRTLGRASTVATAVPQYRQRLLNQRDRASATSRRRPRRERSSGPTKSATPWPIRSSRRRIRTWSSSPSTRSTGRTSSAAPSRAKRSARR